MHYPCPPRRAAVWLMAACLTVSPVSPADTLVSVQSENDAYVGAGDGHYTNGFKLSWAVETDADHWGAAAVRTLPGWGATEVVGMSYRIGHRIYTPTRITLATPQPNDRPYAGVLYAGASIHGVNRHDGWHETHSLRLDTGMVGPSSQAEWIQETFHARIAGDDDPQGWDHQLADEPFLNLGYEHAWVIRRPMGDLQFEYGPTAGVALGNLYAYGSGGFAMRFGEGLDRSFGIPSIAPGQGQRAFFRRGAGLGWYLFAAAEGRYMAHNLLLDGHAGKNGPSVDRRPWVADAQVGFAVNWDRWQLAYTVAVRSKEFETQDAMDSFGSLSLSMWI